MAPVAPACAFGKDDDMRGLYRGISRDVKIDEGTYLGSTSLVFSTTSTSRAFPSQLRGTLVPLASSGHPEPLTFE